MTEPLFEQIAEGVYCIDALYLQPGNACCYLLRGGDDYALIETGTARSAANILATLETLGVQREQLRHVIPTHVHLDHAGGAGVLMASLPAATLLIHPRGVRHMVDPGRLVASARGVYGDAVFADLYGEVLPIAGERIVALEDRDTIEIGDRRLQVRHTRGHADHHFCLYDELTRGWFSGDMFGVSYPSLRFARGSFVMPTTTPTQFNPALYRESVRALAAAGPDCFYLTHYGMLTYEPEQAESLCRQLHAYEELAQRGSVQPADLAADIIKIAQRELECLVPPDTAADLAAQLDMDAQLNAQGIAWWRERAA